MDALQSHRRIRLHARGYPKWLDMAGFVAGTINTRTLVIEPEMLDIVAELDEFKSAWRARSTLAPEVGIGSRPGFHQA